MIFGLTPAGFKTMRLPDIKNALDNALIEEFGNINLDPGTTISNIVAPFCQIAATAWENMDDVYQSQYPASAYGTSLDRVVQINGITRLPATQTLVQCVCGGQEGAFIPANSLAQIPSTGQVFFNALNASITQYQSVYDLVAVQALAPQSYQVLINNIPYFYSLPTITFSTNFVSGNVIQVTINNTMVSATFNTNQATTMADLVTAIETLTTTVASVAISGSNLVLTITPVVGQQNTVDSVSISGGASQPTVDYGFATPADKDAITLNLSSVINTANIGITATDKADETFELNSNIINGAMTPFNLINGANLSVTARSSQVLFTAQNYGVISAPVGSITQIVTPSFGWTTINNLIAGTTGRNIETDSELRIRRKNSILLVGAGTVESIRARILQNVANVLPNGVTIFENTTLTQANSSFTLNAPLTGGTPDDTISVRLNSVTLPTVTYAVSNLATMTVLAALIAAQPNVASASVGGTGNLTITIAWKNSSINVINQVTVTSSPANPVFIENGRPPKCFEAVVQGGLDQDIANEIWLSKPAGIESYGNVTVTVVDSQGNDQSISFSRPNDNYIWVDVALTLDGSGSFPANGISLVQQAIFNYGESLEIGEDVYFQRVLSQIFNVSGIASGNMTTAVTNLPSNTPSYSTSDISISDTSISAWDIGRITVTVV